MVEGLGFAVSGFAGRGLGLRVYRVFVGSLVFREVLNRVTHGGGGGGGGGLCIYRVIRRVL